MAIESGRCANSLRMAEEKHTTNSAPARSRGWKSLILATVLLGVLPAVSLLLGLAVPALRPVALYMLPAGLAAIVLARIALHRMKRGAGNRRDRAAALVGYFAGFLPILYFCGEFTYQLLSLQ